MRPFVFSTLGRAAARNVARGAERVKLFEIGHAFRAEAAGPVEERSLALAAVGRRFPLDWSRPDLEPYDFFDLKGDVEDVVERAAGTALTFTRGSRPWLHPGRQAEIADGEGRPLGFCGELHPRVAAAWGVDARIHVAELDLARIGPPPAVTSLDVPREPSVERDLALVVPAELASAELVRAIRAASVDHLDDVALFDRYQGAQVEAGRVSLGVRLTFQADRTLTDAEVDREVERLVARLAEEHGFRRR